MNTCVVALLVSCGGSSDGGNAPLRSPALTCADDEVAINGSLDGQPVSIRAPLGNYAWIQGSASKTLDVTFETGGAFHAEWNELLPNGETTTITGSVTLPVDAPRGGSTLAGSGTLTKLETPQGGADEVHFELTGLTESVQCVTEPCPSGEVEGTLNGCIKKAPFVF